MGACTRGAKGGLNLSHQQLYRTAVLHKGGGGGAEKDPTGGGRAGRGSDEMSQGGGRLHLDQASVAVLAFNLL